MTGVCVSFLLGNFVAINQNKLFLIIKSLLFFWNHNNLRQDEIILIRMATFPIRDCLCKNCSINRKKMKSIQAIVLLLLVTIFSSCEDERLSTIITDETRDLPVFHKIHLDGVGNVEYIVSEDYKIEVTTHIDLLPAVKTYVSKDELHIDLTGRHKDVKKLEYKVYAPDVYEFKVDGVGDIYCFDQVIADHVYLLQDGVGKINMQDVVAKTIYARMSDVGDIIISGDADQVSYKMDGVGNIRGFDLTARIGEAVLDGVGDIEINASEDLTIDHDGVGKVYYKGSPTIHFTGKNGNIVGVE